LPAGTCSLMKPTIFFAMPISCAGSGGRQGVLPASPFVQCLPSRHPEVDATSGLLDLRKIELHRRRTTEDRHRHAQLALLVVHVLHVAVKVRERPFLDTHRFAHLEQHLRPRFFDPFLHLLQDRVDLLLRNRRRLVGRAADEPGHLGRALHQVPGVVGHLHLDEHVAGEELAFGNGLGAVLHFHHFLDRNEDLAELLGHARALDALGQGTQNALLEPRVCVHDEPLLIAHPSPRPVTNLTSHASDESIANRTSAMITTNANTTAVVWIVSLRVGQDTLLASCQASWPKANNSRPGAVNQATTPAPMSPPSTMSTRSTTA